MLINVMTWNTGITENLDNRTKCNKIFNYIEEFLEKENAIAFLQQMVYKDPQNNWNIHHLYIMLTSRFSACNIKFYKKSSFMMTIAITKKNNSIKLLSDDFYPADKPQNRSIAVEFCNINFLAIHAENGEKNRNFLHSLHGKADIILGDFNAGNYLESENRAAFNSMLKEHICICNMPTKITESGRRTCIDHVFVRDSMVTKCANLIVHEEITLSDHFPITFEITN